MNIFLSNKLVGNKISQKEMEVINIDNILKRTLISLLDETAQADKDAINLKYESVKGENNNISTKIITDLISDNTFRKDDIINTVHNYNNMINIFEINKKNKKIKLIDEEMTKKIKDVEDHSIEENFINYINIKLDNYHPYILCVEDYIYIHNVYLNNDKIIVGIISDEIYTKDSRRYTNYKNCYDNRLKIFKEITIHYNKYVLSSINKYMPIIKELFDNNFNKIIINFPQSQNNNYIVYIDCMTKNEVLIPLNIFKSDKILNFINSGSYEIKASSVINDNNYSGIIFEKYY